MQSTNKNKLLASAVVFLFTNFTFPSAAAAEPAGTPQKLKQSDSAQNKAPNVDMAAPRVVNLSEKEHKAVIRSVDYHHTLLSELTHVLLSFDLAKVTMTATPYGNQKEGFVSLSPANLRTGLVTIETPQNALERNIATLLAHPEEYNLRADLISTQLNPKIVTDSKSSAHFLAMEPWDFRLTSMAHYNQVALGQMMLNAYSTFKAYAELCHKQHPGKPVTIHTGYWGAQYHNSPRMTTAIQLIAASAAGVDKVVFHLDKNDRSAAQALFDAEEFVQVQNGNSVGNILQNMLKMTVQPEWQAGMSFATAKGTNSLDSSFAASE